MRDPGFQPGTLSSVVLWKDHIDLKKINWKNIPTKLSFSIFYYYSNLPRRVTDGLKYFRFWLRFSRVIQILGFKKNWLAWIWYPREIDSPGYYTLGRLTHGCIICTSERLTHRGIIPQEDWLAGRGIIPWGKGYHTPRRLKNSNNSMNS